MSEGHTHDPVVTPFDTVPDFGAHPTVRTKQDGDWSSPCTWEEGRTPGVAGDVVAVSHALTYGESSDAIVSVVQVREGGTLRFRTDRNTRLTVGTLMVLPGGSLEVGSSDQPLPPQFTAEIVLAGDLPPPEQDPKQYGVGLLTWGKCHLFGSPKRSFVRVTGEPRAAATEFRLEEAPMGWLPGDRLALPDTRRLYYLAPTGGEVVTVSSTDSLTVRLQSPLAKDHYGAKDSRDTVAHLPHVANLSRNVVIRSRDPQGVRGHTIFLHRADVDLRCACFKDLGRTTTEPGSQIGRYPLHVHHLWGPQDGREHPFRIEGCVIDGGRKWGLALHDSHFGLIRNNIIHDVEDAGIVTEDGSEYANVIEGNLVAGVRGGSHYVLGFRMTGIANHVRNNVACGVGSSSMPGLGYWAGGPLPYLLRLPLSHGADLTDPSQYREVPHPQTTFLEFSGNEAYGLTVGVYLDHRSGPASGHVLRDTYAWSFFDAAVQAYGTFTPTVIEGAVLCGGTRGVFNYDDMVCRYLHVENCEHGIYQYGFPADLVLEDSILNCSRGVTVTGVGTTGMAFDPAWKRTALLRRVRCSGVTVNMAWDPTTLVPCFPQEVSVYDHQGVAGDNFRVYWPEQLPDAIVPWEEDLQKQAGDTGRTVFGSPEPGLTNAQCWQEYGRAVAGAVAPANASGRLGITGLVGSIG